MDSSIGIRAENLKIRNPSMIAIETETKRHRAAIKVLISDTHQNKQNRCIYELPITFQIPEMSCRDAQLYIYGGLIRALKLDGFDTALDLNTRMCRLLISWSAEEKKEDRALLTELVTSACAAAQLRTSKFQSGTSSSTASQRSPPIRRSK